MLVDLFRRCQKYWWKDKFFSIMEMRLVSPIKSIIFYRWRRNVEISSLAALRVAVGASLKISPKSTLNVKSGILYIGYSQKEMRMFPSHSFTSLILSDQSSMEIEGNVNICPGTIIAVSGNAKILIGSNVLVSSNSFIHGVDGISIGSDTMLSWGVTIMDGDLHNIYSKDSKEQINQSKPIHIGKNVLIGHHATVLKGVSIGDGSVVGANSVVVQDVPSGVIVAGNPAKILRENIYWEK